MSAATSHTAIKFSETFRVPGGAIISPQTYMECMHISPARLAELSGVHQTTLRRSPENERLQDSMREAISVIAMLVDMNGGDIPAAVYWYRNVPLIELGGETAERYVSQGEADSIRDYILNLSAGATG